MKNKISFEWITRMLWALTLVTLPVTSFRYFPFMGAGTYVRPLSLYPLALLGLILLYGIWLKKISIPRMIPGAFAILLLFVLVAITATGLGSINPPIDLRGQDYAGRAIRAFVTLIIGLAFFVVTVWMNQREDDVRFSIRWILIGLIADLAWSGVQYAALTFKYKGIVSEIQRIFSMRGMVNSRRISGFAYEPSWLAGQFSTLYIPWLFAALITNERIFKWKWIEPLLLVASFGVMVLTYSRSGIVFTGIAILVVFIATGRDSIANAWRWFRSGFDHAEGLALRIGLVLILLVGLIGAGSILADREYFTQILDFNKDSLTDYIVDAYAGARAAYVVSALDGFEQNPLLGIGLGASGFVIYDNLPDWSLTFLPEIAEQLSPDSSLYPNPKNIFVRLLSETGLVGFVFFMLFSFSILADSMKVLTHWRYVGIAALMAWIGIMLNGVIQDSFASPENWINLGIVAGIAGQWMIESEKHWEQTS